MATRRRMTAMAMWVATLALAHAAGAQRRPACRRECRDRIAVCVGASLRGPDAAYRACRRTVLAECRRDGVAVCPAIDPATFTHEVAAATDPATLCTATLPDVAVASLAEAAQVGRGVAAMLLGTSAETLRAERRCGPARFCPAAFAKLVGATQSRPLLGLFRVVAVAARGRTYTYRGDAGTVTAIVGRKDDHAFGIAVTIATTRCASPP